MYPAFKSKCSFHDYASLYQQVCFFSSLCWIMELIDRRSLEHKMQLSVASN